MGAVVFNGEPVRRNGRIGSPYAEVRSTAEATGAWRLADALAAEIPAREPGQGVTGNRSDVATVSRLAEIADRLAEDGIETPSAATRTRQPREGWPPMLIYRPSTDCLPDRPSRL